MNSGRRGADRFNVLIVHFSDMIGKGAGCVDYRLSLYVPFLSRKFVFKVSTHEDTFAILFFSGGKSFFRSFVENIFILQLLKHTY